MSQLTVPRPVLRTFRVLACKSENRGEKADAQIPLELQQEIAFRLAIPDVPDAPLMVGVRIKLEAHATYENDVTDAVSCAGHYEAQFYYPAGITEDVVTPLLDDHDYQYVLVAQAFPLAMMHFGRELQAMGFDVRELPLGLPPIELGEVDQHRLGVSRQLL